MEVVGIEKFASLRSGGSVLDPMYDDAPSSRGCHTLRSSLSLLFILKESSTVFSFHFSS